MNHSYPQAVLRIMNPGDPAKAKNAKERKADSEGNSFETRDLQKISD